MKALLLVVALVFGSGALAWIRGASSDPRVTPRSTPIAPAADDAQPRSDEEGVKSDLAEARARIARLEEQVASLRAQLDAAEEARIAREREFLRFTQGISQLETLAGASLPTFQARVPADPDASKSAPGPSADVPGSPSGASSAAKATSATAAPADPAALDAASIAKTAARDDDANAARSHAIFVGLRALLLAEQVQGLDLLESGYLRDGAVGPVVLRVLDERGRPLGSLTADRLRLEASRAARTVTIVLEHGCERRESVRTPFEGGPPDAEGRGGERRIVLSDCDPRPWISGLPELFPAQARDETVDDGRYDRERLRAALNTLFFSEAGDSHEAGTGARAATGWYRLQGLGGVQGVVLRDVALDQVDRDGTLERRFFADRMVFLREGRGLQILLEGGSQMRGDQKTPFLDGRYRVFLPRAAVSAWEKAGVPGLCEGVPPAVQPAPSRR